MEMSDLFKTLKEQYEFLHAYLKTLIRHQEAIISGNIVELEKTIKGEGALLVIMENYQKKIISLIKNLSSKYLLELQNYSLSDFVTAVKENDRYNADKLGKMQNSLMKMGNEIIKVNNQNKLLVDQARYLIKGTISAIVNENNEPILDRTI